MAQLARMQFVIDEDYTETYLPGTLTTLNQNQTVLTTIPYDEGWQVTVDGKKVETVELANALVGYYIDEPGEHEIEMRYCPKELVLGVAVSIVSTIAFFLLIIFEKLLRRIGGYGEFFRIPEPVAHPANANDTMATADDTQQTPTDQTQQSEP
jgi:hypothetical protein